MPASASCWETAAAAALALALGPGCEPVGIEAAVGQQRHCSFDAAGIELLGPVAREGVLEERLQSAGVGSPNPEPGQNESSGWAVAIGLLD